MIQNGNPPISPVLLLLFPFILLNSSSCLMVDLDFHHLRERSDVAKITWDEQ